MINKKAGMKRFLLLMICFFSLTRVFALEEEQESEQVPISFVRDVMQPMGIHVVTSFHAVRENLFLNTRMDKAGSLESIGNFFLTPSQYLFAGRTISVCDDRQSDFEVTQSFSYGKWHWLKTILSLLVLPICEPIGISLKGVAYLSPDVRHRHMSIAATLKDPLAISHLHEYSQKGIAVFHCDEFIPCQGHKRPSFLTKKQKVEIQALKEIVSLFEEHKVLYWVDFGTCLGAYRYGGIIPWDWDIDIAIIEQDHEVVKRILSTLDPNKYQIQDWSSYDKPKTLLKLYVKETKNFIDIYHYKIDENEKSITYNYTYENSPFPYSWKRSDLRALVPLKYEQFFPLKKANFDGLMVWAPNHVEEFLHIKYGENLDPSMIWDEELMTYTKVLDHPYWVHIN